MKSKNMYYAKLFTDMMSEGFIVINEEGNISLYNEAAKKIFGLKDDSEIKHSQGKLEKGDILIIANSSMGTDDGYMDGESLKLLGLEKNQIRKKDPFIVISRYKEKNIDFSIGKEDSDRIRLINEDLDIEIDGLIDLKDKIISIRVEGQVFSLEYINSIGHIVVLDGKTKKLKFYQTNGYTARQESINDLLKGNSYKAKGHGEEYLEVIGKNIFDIHSSESLIQDFYKVAKGKNISYKDKYEEINGYPTLCTLNPVDDQDKRIGAALKVENIFQIERVINDRDRILKELEAASLERREKKIFKEVFKDFIGESGKMLEVKRSGLRASQTLSSVLITGEPGVGKSLLARKIHENSKLKDLRFTHINGELESPNVFFRKLGRMEAGTLYVEEVGGLSLDLQEELLSFLSLNEMEKNLRVITSSSENLDGKLIKRTFNEDLYYKINVFPIFIPPLRSRGDDIELLVNYILPNIALRTNTEDKRISAEALNLIRNYNWPNNVRELINVLERAVNLTLGRSILTKHVKFYDEMEALDRNKSLKEQLEDREKLIIQSTLSKHKGNRKKAIEELQISQSTFYERLNKYNIT